MKKFQMKHLLLSSLFFLLLISCSVPAYRNLHQVEDYSYTGKEFTGFWNYGLKKALYKASVDVYGNHFSGLLLIKELEDESCRVVFLNEMGLKILDLEFKGEKFKVHHCFSAFDKWYILNTIEKDLKLVLLKDVTGEHKPVLFRDGESGERVYKLESEGLYNYYFVNGENGQLERLENASSSSRKVVISFNDYQNNWPRQIEIKHESIDLNITLNLLKRD